MATDILKEQYNNLLEENDQYKKLTSQQKDHLMSLDKEMTVAENRIQEKLTVPGGIRKQQGKYRRYRKYIRILENKLSQDTVKFDELLCSNTDYRKDLAHLLQQKGNIKGKFNRQLAAQQNLMKDLLEKFTLALNQRSEAESRMLEARESIEVETAHFIKRQMQLKVFIDHDTKLNTFMERKLQEMIPLEDNEDFKKKKQQQYQSGVKKVEIYMQGHRTLVEVTGEKDLRQIGHMFIQNEQMNSAHIGYINELHSRRNMLKSCTIRMKSDIMSLEQENKRHDEQSDSQFKDLESELEKYSRLADSLEKQHTEAKQTLDQLKTAISDLLDETMQEAVTVTFDNIARFISILEESTSNLLIQANNVEDDQVDLPPQNLLLANYELLPECEAVVETERGRTPTRSVKSA